MNIYATNNTGITFIKLKVLKIQRNIYKLMIENFNMPFTV